MAVAKEPTLLALDRFAEILGINPAHFNQGASTTVMPMLTNCPDIYYQFAWQRADCVSREEIARGIRQAEEEIADV